jgi:hypothetical protein
MGVGEAAAMLLLERRWARLGEETIEAVRNW